MKKDSAIEFLEAVLNIPSVNGHDDEGKLAAFLDSYLNGCGVESRIISIDSMHSDVIALVPGTVGAKETVILNGHLDTVPYGSEKEWNSDPGCCRIQDGLAVARGASDMKSGLAGMVYLLGCMMRQGISPAVNLCFLGTCDEEKGGLGAEKIVNDALMPEASLLLIGEPTDLRAGVAQKGCLWLELTAEGVTSHGAYPWEGVNAVQMAVDLFQEFKKELEADCHPVLGRATAQITQINGGVAPNMTPDRCVMLMDVRILPGMEPELLIQRLEDRGRRAAAAVKGKGAVHIRVINCRRAIEVASDNSWLIELKQILGKEKVTGLNYFTDASILTRGRENMPVLLFGPGAPDMAHKPNESVELEKYLSYIEILKKLFYNL